jgi:hypothetical protein
MSRLEIFTILPNGDIGGHSSSIANPFGGAWHIWECLNNKYGFAAPHFFDYGYERLWKHIGDMPEDDQWVLGSTFDGAMIRWSDIPQFVAALKRFEAEFPSQTLRIEMDDLELSLRMEDEPPGFIGICFNQTSVSPGWEPDFESGYEVFNVFRDKNNNTNEPGWWMAPGAFGDEKE